MVKIVNDLDERILGTMGITTPNSRAITYNGKLVGIIDFYVKHNYIKIMYITVSDEYRRLGIAREVINILKDNHKGKYMYGDALPGAIKFWENMGAEFHEDPFDDYLTPFSIEC